MRINTVWMCHYCGRGITKQQVARVDSGHYYHIPCWEHMQSEAEKQAVSEGDFPRHDDEYILGYD